MNCAETAFGIVPFEPYDHAADAEELERERDAADDAGIVQYFDCPRCSGHGCHMNKARTEALVCEDCGGKGLRGANEGDLEAANAIGSNNPFCSHDWNQTAGEADESGGRIYCLSCGADGDA